MLGLLRIAKKGTPLMGRLTIVRQLDPTHQQQVDDCIRSNRYTNGRRVAAQLEAAGINISRSALYRYMATLRSKDAAHTGTADDTVVTIVERSTGAVTTVTTGATRTALIGLIAAAYKP